MRSNTAIRRRVLMAQDETTVQHETKWGWNSSLLRSIFTCLREVLQMIHVAPPITYFTTWIFQLHLIANGKAVEHSFCPQQATITLEKLMKHVTALKTLSQHCDFDFQNFTFWTKICNLQNAQVREFIPYQWQVFLAPWDCM